jgi:tRNA-specific 2-thiouridylase
LVRYRGTPLPARISKSAGGARVQFEKPASAVVPGQFAVFYQGERVLGGGLIRQAVAAQASAAQVTS